MQPVQTLMRVGVPEMSARTRWMLGSQRRLVRRCEWETFMPNDGFLPQISQTDAMMNVLLFTGSRPMRLRRNAKDHCSIATNDHFDDAVRSRRARHDINVCRVFALAHKEVINRLNVYPVPDGDTGTNMTLTIESVVTELGPLGDDATMDDTCQAIAHGSLMGARGNSGVILSQLLRGPGGEIQGPR
jgi:hypothetical protein